MDALTRPLVALVRLLMRYVPLDRRGWGEAALVELDHVPPGREQLSWAAGALRVMVGQAGLTRKVAIGIAAVAASVVIVIMGWHGDWSNPATPVNRIFLISGIALLLALPLLFRSGRLFGPVADNAAARVVRVGGYTGVFALLPIVIAVGNFAGHPIVSCGDCSAAEEAQWYDDRISDAIAGSLLIFVIVVAYAVLILWLTSRRAAMTAPGMVIGGLGAVVAGPLLYAMAPASAPLNLTVRWLSTLLVVLPPLVALAAPFISGVMARSRTQSANTATDLPVSGMRQGAQAGVLTATGGVLILTILTVPTMLLFPGSVPLKWANPSPAVPHGTVAELQMSVGDAAVRFLLWMALAPLLGAVLGIAGAGAAGAIAAASRRRATVPTHSPSPGSVASG